MDNITIIGTSHIAKQSVDYVSKYIEHENPDIVAIELDPKRYAGLQDKSRKRGLPNIFKIGVKGFIFNVIGAFVEKKLGKIVGVDPGADMLAAINSAKKKNMKIALIDQDIEITLKKLSLRFSWKEKWNFFVDVLRGIIYREKELEKLGIKDLDLTKVPTEDIIYKMIEQLKKRYPNLYSVLIDERNRIMAERLYRIRKANLGKKIAAVVGAGHKKGMEKILSDMDNHEHNHDTGLNVLGKGYNADIRYNFSVGKDL